MGKLKKKTQTKQKSDEKIQNQQEPSPKNEAVIKRKSSKEELDKKREKNRVKKLQKRQEKRGEIVSTVGKDEALEYLKSWHNDKSNWRFMKVRQTFLLKNMLKPDMISDEEFDILVKYLTGVKGNAKTMTLKNAQKHMIEADSKSGERKESDVQMYQRAEKIAELLQN